MYATLLDEGTYLASERTMYRILEAHAEVRERRAQARHPAYAAPELLAEAPDELWSWDITKLKGPRRGIWFHLYVLLDVFSRYVPGWLVATRESAALAERLIAETVAKEGIARATLKLHADRGSPMTLPAPRVPTTRTANRSSRRSSTATASRSASARSRMPGPSWARSSPGTTVSIAMSGSGC